MEIRKATEKDKEIIIKLWKYSFNTDSQSFIDHYFSNIYSPENTLLAMESNKITTSLQLNPYSFLFMDRIIETKYIVGISSFPASRGSGSVKKLFNNIFQNLYKEKMPFIFLMGADYGLYTPFGFTNILDKYIISGKTKQLYQKTEKKHSFREITKDSNKNEIESITLFLKKNLSHNYSYYIVRNKNNFKNNLKEILTENGFAYYLLKDNEISGYFFYYFEKDKIVIKEMFYNDTDTLKEILKFIYNHNTQFPDFEIRDDFLKTTNSFLQNPREIESKVLPFLMARIINLKEFLSLCNLEKLINEELKILITDKLIEENNLLGKIKDNKMIFHENYDELDYHVSLDISLLLSLCFGYMNTKEGLLQTHLYSFSDKDKRDIFFNLFYTKKNIFFNEYV